MDIKQFITKNCDMINDILSNCAVIKRNIIAITAVLSVMLTGGVVMSQTTEKTEEIIIPKDYHIVQSNYQTSTTKDTTEHPSLDKGRNEDGLLISNSTQKTGNRQPHRLCNNKIGNPTLTLPLQRAGNLSLTNKGHETRQPSLDKGREHSHVGLMPSCFSVFNNGIPIGFAADEPEPSTATSLYDAVVNAVVGNYIYTMTADEIINANIGNLGGGLSGVILTIAGQGFGVNGNGKGGITVNSGQTLTLQNIGAYTIDPQTGTATVTNDGWNNFAGGFRANSGSILNIDNVVLKNNTASTFIENYGATINISNSLFEGNNGSGKFIFTSQVNGAVLNITDTNFINNKGHEGVIFARFVVNIFAKDRDVLFSGNRFMNTDTDIDIRNHGTINLFAQEGRSITLAGGIDGIDRDLPIYIGSDDYTGTVNINSIKYDAVTINGGTVNIGTINSNLSTIVNKGSLTVENSAVTRGATTIGQTNSDVQPTVNYKSTLGTNTLNINNGTSVFDGAVTTTGTNNAITVTGGVATFNDTVDTAKYNQTGGTVNANGAVTATNASVAADGVLNIGASNLNVINGLANKGNVSLSTGTLTTDITNGTGSGVGTTNITGNVINDADITQGTLAFGVNTNLTNNANRTISISQSLNVGGANDQNRSLTNYGTINITGENAVFNVDKKSVFTNTSDAVLNLTGQNSTLRNISNRGTFTNQGTANLSGSGSFIKAINVYNSGDINLTGSGSYVYLNGSNTGNVTATGNNTIVYLDNGSSSGTITVSGTGARVDVSGNFTNSGVIETNRLYFPRYSGDITNTATGNITINNIFDISSMNTSSKILNAGAITLKGTKNLGTISGISTTDPETSEVTTSTTGVLNLGSVPEGGAADTNIITANKNVSNQNINLVSGTLKISNTGALVNNVGFKSAGNTTLDTQNSKIDDLALGEVELTGDLSAKINVDLSGATTTTRADRFSGTLSANNTSDINIDNINVISAGDRKYNKAYVSDANLASIITNNVSTISGYDMSFDSDASGAYLYFNNTNFQNLVTFVRDMDRQGTTYTMSADVSVTTDFANLGDYDNPNTTSIGALVGEGANLTINGGGYGVNGNNKGGISVASGQTLNIRNIGMDSEGNIIGKGIYGFTAATTGTGVLYNSYGGLNVTNTVFSNNNVSAIFGGDNQSITNSLFQYNCSTTGTLAPWAFSTTTITDTDFHDNIATSLAGAVGARGANDTFNIVIIAKNKDVSFVNNRMGSGVALTNNGDGTYTATGGTLVDIFSKNSLKLQARDEKSISFTGTITGTGTTTIGGTYTETVIDPETSEETTETRTYTGVVNFGNDVTQNNININSGTVNANGAVAVGNALTINNGTATFNDTVTATNLTQGGGTANYNDTVTASGNVSINNGTADFNSTVDTTTLNVGQTNSENTPTVTVRGDLTADTLNFNHGTIKTGAYDVTAGAVLNNTNDTAIQTLIDGGHTVTKGMFNLTNLIVNGCTIDTQNGYIDPVQNLGDVTLNNDLTLAIDVNPTTGELDNITYNSLSGTGKFNYQSINTLADTAFGTRTTVTADSTMYDLFTSGTSETPYVRVNGLSAGKSYRVFYDNTDGSLVWDYGNLYQAVKDTQATRIYTLYEDEPSPAVNYGAMGGTNSTLTIEGNGYGVNGNGKGGITVGSGQTLTVKDVAEVGGFDGAFVNNAGSMNVVSEDYNVSFADSNQANINNTADLNLFSADGKTISFTGSITDASTPTGTMNIGGTYTEEGQTKTYSGTVDFGNTVTQNTLNLNSGTVHMGVNNGFNVNNVTVNGGTLDTVTNAIETQNLKTLTLNSDLNLAIDVNPATGALDSITYTSLTGTGKFNYVAINALADTAYGTRTTVTDDSSKYDLYSVGDGSTPYISVAGVAAGRSYKVYYDNTDGTLLWNAINLYAAVKDTAASRSYTMFEDEPSPAVNYGAMGGANSTLTIEGNGFGVKGYTTTTNPSTGVETTTRYSGISVANGQTLNINNIGSYTVDSQTGEVTVTNNGFEGFTKSDTGAVIGNSGNTNITNSVFSNNISSVRGAVYNAEGLMTIKDSVFYKNSATGQYSGALQNGVNDSSADLILDNTKFIENTSKTYAGAFLNTPGPTYGTVITNSEFVRNFAGTSGGAIRNDSGVLTDTNSVYIGNYATTVGGAIDNVVIATITGDTFTGNIAGTQGGAIYNAGTITIIDPTFTGNIAGTQGGAIWNSGTATIKADTKDVIFDGSNKSGATITRDEETGEVTVDLTNAVSNDIHNQGTLNLNAGVNDEGEEPIQRVIKFESDITGNRGGVINVNPTEGYEGKVLLDGARATDSRFVVSRGDLEFKDSGDANITVTAADGETVVYTGDFATAHNNSTTWTNIENAIKSGGTMTVDSANGNYYGNNNQTYVTVNGGKVNTENSVFAGNTGYTVHVANGGVANIGDGTLFTGNSSTGVNVASGGVANIDNAVFSGNTNTLISNAGTMSINDVTIVNNNKTGIRFIENSGTITSFTGIISGNTVRPTGSAGSDNYLFLHTTGTIDTFDVTFSDNAVIETAGGANPWGVISTASNGIFNNVYGKFERNKVEVTQGDTTYGAEGMYTARTGRMIADFIENGTIAQNSGRAAGIIAAAVDYISSNFIGNYSYSVSGNAYGGVFEKSTITTIENSTFIGNYARGGANAYGGVFWGEGRTTGTIKDSIFTGNYAIGGTGGGYGGAIYNVNYSSTVGVIAGIVDTDFTNNVAKSQGGAIYNGGSISIIADSKDVKFENNRIGSDAEVVNNGDGTYTAQGGELNDIYNTGTLNLRAKGVNGDEPARTISFTGSITGAVNASGAPTNGTMNIGGTYEEEVDDGEGGTTTVTKNYDGTVEFNNSVTQQTLNIQNGAGVKLGGYNETTGATLPSAINEGDVVHYGSLNLGNFRVLAGGGALDTQNSHIESNTLGATTLTGDLELRADIDLANSVSDYFNATSVASGTGKMIITSILTNSDLVSTDSLYTKIQIVSNTLKGRVAVDGGYIIVTNGDGVTGTYRVGYGVLSDGGYLLVAKDGARNFVSSARNEFNMEDSTRTYTMTGDESVKEDIDALAGFTNMADTSVGAVKGNFTLEGEGHGITGSYNNAGTTARLGGMTVAAGNELHIKNVGAYTKDAETGDVTVTNNGFTGFEVAGNGGVINNAGTLSIENSVFKDNRAYRSVSSGSYMYGGVIYNTGEITQIKDSYFEGNYANAVTTGDQPHARGGVIHNIATGVIGNVSADFVGNYVQANAGANWSYAYGGAIYNLGQIGNISGDFIENYGVATEKSSYLGFGYGGAIYNSGDIESIVGNFIGNYIQGDANNSYGHTQGGAIYNSGTIGYIEGQFVDNAATCSSGSYGGAIYNSGTITMGAGEFSGNSATTGGAVYSYGNDSHLTISNTTFQDNTATNGGAIYNYARPDAVLTNVSFLNNRAVTNGGAIFTLGSMDFVANDGYTSTFSGNYIGAATAEYTQATSNAIYFWGHRWLNFLTSDGGKFVIEDKITGRRGYNILFSGERAGDITLNTTVTNAHINLTKDDVLSGSSPILSSLSLNMTNDKIGDTDFDDLTITTNHTFGFDVDLAQGQSDRITANSVTTTNKINIDDIHLISDNDGTTSVALTDNDTLKSAYQLANLITLHTSTGQDYNISYDNATGELTFEKANLVDMSALGVTTLDRLHVTDSSIPESKYNLTEVNSPYDGDMVVSKYMFNTTTGNLLGKYYRVNLEGDSAERINDTLADSDVNGVVFYGQNTTGNGGAILNTKDNSTVDIYADFIGNYSYNIGATDRRAGAIYNTGKLGNVTGDFIGNYTMSVMTGVYGQGYGGAIFSNNEIGDITGDFINNFASSVTTDHSGNPVDGGAIYLSGVAGNITGNFIGNYVVNMANRSERYARGGALYITNAVVGDIMGRYFGNYAWSEAGSGYAGGGVMYVTTSNGTGSIGDVSGEFAGNYANGSGGVMYVTTSNGTGSVGDISGEFAGNYASGSGGVMYVTTSNGTVAIGLEPNKYVANVEMSHDGSTPAEIARYIHDESATIDISDVTGGDTGVDSIIGTYTKNYIDANSNSALGGSVFNFNTGANGTILIGNINLDLIDNYSSNINTQSSNKTFGAIYITTSGNNTGSGRFIMGNITPTSGTFSGNRVYSKYLGYGSVIGNYSMGLDADIIIGNITGNFTDNASESTYNRGGAIANYAHAGSITIGDITGDFTDNYAKGSQAWAGAIWNEASGNSYASVKVGDISGNFSGNYAQSNANTYTSGGVIANYTAVRDASIEIGNITGNFTDNYIYNPSTGTSNWTRGGVIGNFMYNTYYGKIKIGNRIRRTRRGSVKPYCRLSFRYRDRLY